MQSLAILTDCEISTFGQSWRLEAVRSFAPACLHGCINPKDGVRVREAQAARWRKQQAVATKAQIPSVVWYDEQLNIMRARQQLPLGQTGDILFGSLLNFNQFLQKKSYKFFLSFISDYWIQTFFMNIIIDIRSFTDKPINLGPVIVNLSCQL